VLKFATDLEECPHEACFVSGEEVELLPPVAGLAQVFDEDAFKEGKPAEAPCGGGSVIDESLFDDAVGFHVFEKAAADGLELLRRFGGDQGSGSSELGNLHETHLSSHTSSTAGWDIRAAGSRTIDGEPVNRGQKNFGLAVNGAKDRPI
jgi:hypothetical protein